MPNKSRPLSGPKPTESFSRQRIRALKRAARKENMTGTQRHTADRAILEAKKNARRNERRAGHDRAPNQ